MIEKKHKLLIVIFLFYIVIIAEHFLIEFGLNVSYGKDGGLIFRIFSLCILGSAYFFFISNLSVKYLFLGFLLGLISCYLTFRINLYLGEILNNEMGGLNISLIYLMLTAGTMIIILGLLYNRFLKPSASANVS